MSPEASYSIYVRFRGRRLALIKHIRPLSGALAALAAVRAERFHDADQVFLVNDVSKQAIVEDRAGEPPAASAPEPDGSTGEEGGPFGWAEAGQRCAPDDRPPEPDDHPITRMRRAIERARSAHARHDAAVRTLVELRQRGALHDEEMRRLETSARSSAELCGRTLSQLERVVSALDRSGA